MNIELKYTETLKSALAKESYDKKYGARPLRRAIQRYVEDELSDMILKSELKNGQTVLVEIENSDNKLKFTVK